jgi:hypothetical protein
MDVLVDGLSVGDARAALRQVRAGAGGELTPSRGGNVSFCSAESSALMAVNFLAPFLSRGGLLGLADGTTTFERELRLRGVRSRVGPTLEVAYASANGTILIEAKTAEPWRAAPKVAISEQYDGPAEATSPGTLETLHRLRSGAIAYRCLDAAQLLKHLLAANSALREGTLRAPIRLLLLFWQPRVTAPFTSAFERLASELDDLADRLADQPVALSSLSTSQLLAVWGGRGMPRWLRNHARELRGRYDVVLG